MPTENFESQEGSNDSGSIQTRTFITSTGTINRKVAFASIGAVLGSFISIIIPSLLLSIPWVSKLDKQDIGELKASIGSAITALITLGFGYYVKPGSSDGIIEEQNPES